MKIKSKVVVAVLLVLMPAIAPAAHAAEIFFPGNAEMRTGRSNQSFPFNIGGGSQHYQQLYLGSVFGSGPVTISTIKFRQASDTNGGSPFSVRLSDISISLSTATTRVGAIGTTFANNIGADTMSVFSGALDLSSSAPALRNDTPQPFDIVINFTTPFAYDPAQGDLLLDVVNRGGGNSTQFDFITGGSTVFSRAFTLPSQNAGTPTGFAQQGAGLVTAFTTIDAVGAVPEPATWTMLILGFGAIGGTLRTRKRTALLSAA